MPVSRGHVEVNYKMASLAIARLIVWLAIVAQLISFVLCYMANNERYLKKASTIFEMMPSGEQRVVNEGNFNISCRIIVVNATDPSVYIGNITWTLPETTKNYKETPLERTLVGKNLTFTSTLITLNATSQGTGNYSCLYTEAINSSVTDILSITQYIDIKGKDMLLQLKMPDSLDRFSIDAKGTWWGLATKGIDLIIPCVATQPNVNISISRQKYVNEFTFLQEVKEENLSDKIKMNIRSSTNSEFTYDYNRGLILKNVRVSDSGVYTFRGSLRNMTSEIIVHLRVEGTELEVAGESHDEIEVGGNVTLICTIYPYLGPTILWKYGKNKLTNLMEFNETHPPIGLEPPKLKILLHSTAVESSMKLGQSTLQFFNVTRKLYSTYECKDVPNDNISNRVSLRFYKSKENDPEVKQIKGGMQTVMSCTTTEDATDFQWFKNKQRINITGQQTNNLTLVGDPNDSGLYECIYVDEFGHERHIAFNVTIYQPALPIVIIVVSVILICLLVVTFAIVIKKFCVIMDKNTYSCVFKASYTELESLTNTQPYTPLL